MVSMRSLFLTLTLSVFLWSSQGVYEVRWDGTLCTLSGGSDRRLLRKSPTQESCHFPIPVQKQCLIAAFSNTKTVRYDGDKIILTPLSPREPALADIWCEPVR